MLGSSGSDADTELARATRRWSTPDFRATVVVASLEDDKILADPAQTYGIHPAMITQGKGRLEKEAAHVFKGAERKAGHPVDANRVYRKIAEIETARYLLLASLPGIIAALHRGRR